MKQLAFLLSLFLVLTWAASLEAAPKMKVAVVNVQQAISQSKVGKKAKAYFEQKLRAKETQFRARGMKIKEKDDELKAAMMLSEGARAKKTGELNKLKRALQRAVQKARGDYRQEESKRLHKISQGVLMAVRKVGERDKYDLVIEATLRQTLLYTRTDITDITEEVVKVFDKMKMGGG